MTKRWLDMLVVSSVRFVKGALALALCLGTLGVALTFVGVSPAAAAGVPTITSVTPATGLPAGGTKVTIIGTNLAPATAVDFGAGNAATITSDAAGKIVIDSSPASPLAVTGVRHGRHHRHDRVGHLGHRAGRPVHLCRAPTVTALYGGNAPTGGGTTIIIQGTNFVGVTAVDFATTAATSFTVQSSTANLGRGAGDRHRDRRDRLQPDGHHRGRDVGQGDGQPVVLVRHGHLHLQRHRGGEQRGATGASAYIQGAVAGTSTTLPSGGTAIPTSCTGLSGLGTTAPMLESLGAPTAAVVTGTGPGGNGGNEEWLGWSGANGYSDTSSSTYNAPSPGFQLPESGPSTSGGCPVSLLVRDGGVGGDAGVLRHRPRRDLPTITGRDRRRFRRLRRDGPDGAVGHAS